MERVTRADAQSILSALNTDPAGALFTLAMFFDVPPPTHLWVDQPSERACEGSCVRPSGVIELNRNTLHHAHQLNAHVHLPPGVPHAVFILLHEFGHYLQWCSRQRFGDEEDADRFAEAILRRAILPEPPATTR